MKMKPSIVITLLLASLGIGSWGEKIQEKRGIESFGHGGGFSSRGIGSGYEATIKTVTSTVHVPVPQPYPVVVNRPVPVPVPQPYQVPVPRPVQVAVPVPQLVSVPRPVPYTVTRPVPYPVKVPIHVPYKIPVHVSVPQPYPVEVPQPYPVKVPQTIVVPVPQPIHHINDEGKQGLKNGELGNEHEGYSFSSVSLGHHHYNSHSKH